MYQSISDLPVQITELIKCGCVIPAHPLALDENRHLDIRRQKALSRYYLDAGVGGLAVGVHTTQFAIREHGIYENVLRLAAETAANWTDRSVLLIAGVAGKTKQAIDEAVTARSLGYHAALLNVAAFNNASESEIIKHCKAVAKEIPLIGFYLLPEVGGRHLSYDFWREFCDIDNVIAIKVAAFNRYGTLNVVRAVVDAGKEDDITLYTGNDDAIVHDLLVPFLVRRGEDTVKVRFKGGLLGHWSVWTRRAVEQLDCIHHQSYQSMIPTDLLSLDAMVTDCNAAIYDAKHSFAGCIPGCLKVLERQGLLATSVCLDPNEVLSAGQAEEIERVYQAYPEMNDDQFVKDNLARWLAE